MQTIYIRTNRWIKSGLLQVLFDTFAGMQCISKERKGRTLDTVFVKVHKKSKRRTPKRRSLALKEKKNPARRGKTRK